MMPTIGQSTFLRKNPDAVMILDYLREHPRTRGAEIGKAFPEIPLNRRTGLMQKMLHLGLIRKVGKFDRHPIWEATEVEER